MTRYSHSKLQTFEQCRLKFKFKYIDKIIPIIPKTIEAHLGSSVHDTLEWLYNQVILEKTPNIDQTITYFTESWQKKKDPNLLIVNKSMTEKDYFNKGVQFILDYYLKHRPFQDNTLELEKKITLKLGENNEHEIIGFIDRLAKNKEKDEFEIHDYKTANSIPSKEKIDKDRQLALYSIAIKEQFGNQSKVSLNWHYLAYGERITIRKTDQELDQLKQEIIQLIKQIESSKEFPATKSKLCDWCEYKSICPAWHTPEQIQENKEKFNERDSNDKNNMEELKTKYPTLLKYLKD